MIKLSRRDFVAGMAASALAVARAAAQTDEAPIRLVAAPGTADLAGSELPATDVWSFGSVPGPEIRVRAGERVRVLLENRLPEPTTVHWHGIRIDNAMDGVPDLTQAAVPPGETFLYDFTAPDPGTFWYHSHFRSYEQVDRGLYGPLIVTGDEDGAQAIRDVTLVIDDWRLEENGQIHAESFGAPMDASHGGRMGNWLTVNGRTEETVAARPGERLRLRLISAATARVMKFDLGDIDGRIVALDGWPLATPRALEGPVTIAPAQRMDIVVDLPGAEEVIGVDEVSTGEPLRAFAIEVAGEIAAPRTKAYSMIARPGPALDLAAARRIRLVMEGGAMGQMGAMMHNGRQIGPRDMMELGLFWAFNGVLASMENAAPLASLARGETAVVEIENLTAWPHGMHLHGNHMKVVGRNRASVADGDWRDTVLVMPDERIDVAFAADNPGKWLFHCHMLDHAASGMSSWIEVA